MELDGAKRGFAFLKSFGLKIPTFISDRHRGIAKWIRQCHVNTKHFFDIWHVARSVTKKMLSASKEKGCEVISGWMKGVRNHLYWCATSTKEGFGEMILAKWKSLVNHISNKHNGHQDNLFKECAHDHLQPRKWIKIGTLLSVFYFSG